MFLQRGAVVFVRGVNDHYVGRIVDLLPGRVVHLEQASWVADSGRLGEFVAQGRTADMEIEPVGDMVIFWQEIIHWPHRLFTEAI